MVTAAEIATWKLTVGAVRVRCVAEGDKEA
jgi:hypothetical protein